MATRALHDTDELSPMRSAHRMVLVPSPAGGPPESPSESRAESTAAERAEFGPSRRSRLTAALAVALLHAVVIGGILTHRVMVQQKRVPEALALLQIPAAPPPPHEAPKVVVETPPVVIPPPVFEIENRQPSITAVVSENPPPPQPAPVTAVAEGPPSPAPAPPRPPAVVSGGDLSATMVQAVPPRYPYESRRLKEQGTVVLDVLLAPDGHVERCAIRTSSGSPRLDNAALDAVRRWRWSPMTRDGVAVAVRGLVEIPFILSPKDGGRGGHHGERREEPRAQSAEPA